MSCEFTLIVVVILNGNKELHRPSTRSYIYIKSISSQPERNLI